MAENRKSRKTRIRAARIIRIGPFGNRAPVKQGLTARKTQTEDARNPTIGLQRLPEQVEQDLTARKTQTEDARNPTIGLQRLREQVEQDLTTRKTQTEDARNPTKDSKDSGKLEWKPRESEEKDSSSTPPGTKEICQHKRPSDRRSMKVWAQTTTMSGNQMDTKCCQGESKKKKTIRSKTTAEKAPHPQREPDSRGKIGNTRPRETRRKRQNSPTTTTDHVWAEVELSVVH